MKEEYGDQNGVHGKKYSGSCHRHQLDEPRSPVKIGKLDSDEEQTQLPETTVWIRRDVYDTGIGIPENALPTLFKRYMQVGAD
ncbi:hypothetical protein SLA2020_216030 [Shorea laevis]